MEPWEYKSDESRKVNSIKTFIIFCEDGAVEPAYFELFNRHDVKISTHSDKKQHHAQVDSACEFFREKDLLIYDKEKGHEILNIDDGAQVWCVFDRDKNPYDGLDTAFNDSINNANVKGIKTAWSNDDFELWILLHFEDVDPADEEYSNRLKYYERLTKLLQDNFPDEKSFQNERFSYKDTMKGRKKFLLFTYQLMKGKTLEAVARAEKLENYQAVEQKPPHLLCPCTMVHYLVKELLAT